MMNLVDEHKAAVAAVVLAVSMSTLGIMWTLTGVGLVVVMGTVLRRARLRAEARRAETFASGREHLVANLLVALPYLLAPCDATNDLYRESISTLHDLAGDEPRPGALLGAALLLAARARSQVRGRRQVVRQAHSATESPDVTVEASDRVVARLDYVESVGDVHNLRRHGVVDVDVVVRLKGEVLQRSGKEWEPSIPLWFVDTDEPEGC